ncbi:MAG: ATP-binding protein [Proteobacteria bacterium]|nr:ATP-binding protein [Pseudomonadota bacterium]
MRRIRLALVALAAVILVPVVLLVDGARESLELERAVRHEAVAERTFDEMERTLSEFLGAEEARPIDDYRAADGRPAPLENRAAPPFVLGYFELESGGALRVLRARAPAAVDAQVQSAFRRERAAALEKGRRDAAERQAPGTTLKLGQAAKAARPPAAEPEDPSSAGPYEVLQSLNRAAPERVARKERAEARKKRARAQSPPPPPQAAPTPSLLGRAFESSSDALVLEEEADLEAFAAGIAYEDGFADEDKAAEEPEAEAEPMVGRAAGEEQWILYRTIVTGGRAARQGLVLDRAELAAWLIARVIETSELADVARVDLLTAGTAPVPVAASRYGFQHRFLEPFDGVALQLDLPPLDELDGARRLYGLALAFALVTVLGLFAVERMVRVVVDFAERRSNFVAAVSHELKTPLTAIRMYAEMLRDGLVSSAEKRGEYTRTITDESERLSRLIDNVLEFSRLEKGNHELRLHVGAVAPLLEEVAETLRPHAERLGFQLVVDSDPELPQVRFDRDAVLQVLFNLVDNAMKYAAAAAVREIRLEAHAHEGDVVISVRDFGPGLPPGRESRVFEPFYRGESELTRTTQGTGIGLALVRELTSAMGARVAAANAEGGGLRVEIGFSV